MNDKLDNHLDLIAQRVRTLKPNFDTDWGSGALYFEGTLRRRFSDGQPKSSETVWVWATPYWEGHEGIPFSVETLLGDYPEEFQKDVLFPKDTLTYDVEWDTRRYINLVTEQARVLGITI